MAAENLVIPVVRQMPEREQEEWNVIGAAFNTEKGSSALRAGSGTYFSIYRFPSIYHVLTPGVKTLGGLLRTKAFLGINTTVDSSVSDLRDLMLIAPTLPQHDAESELWSKHLIHSLKTMLVKQLSASYKLAGLPQPEMRVLPLVASGEVVPSNSTLVLGKAEQGPAFALNEAALVTALGFNQENQIQQFEFYVEPTRNERLIFLPTSGVVLEPNDWISDTAGNWNPFLKEIPSHLGMKSVQKFWWAFTSSLGLAK
jgi:hypothetical protein